MHFSVYKLESFPFLVFNWFSPCIREWTGGGGDSHGRNSALYATLYGHRPSWLYSLSSSIASFPTPEQDASPFTLENRPPFTRLRVDNKIMHRWHFRNDHAPFLSLLMSGARVPLRNLFSLQTLRHGNNNGTTEESRLLSIVTIVDRVNSFYIE